MAALKTGPEIEAMRATGAVVAEALRALVAPASSLFGAERGPSAHIEAEWRAQDPRSS